MGDGKSYRNDSMRYAHPDSIERDSALMFKTLKLRREVYAGGGITPDIYISPKSIDLSDIVAQSIDNGIVEHSVIEFWDRGSMKGIKALYPTVYEFANGYKLSPTLWQILQRRAGYNYDSIAEHERQFIEILVLASLAERLYGNGANDYIYISMFDYMAEQAITIANRDITKDLFTKNR